jgi:hypothetical protein
MQEGILAFALNSEAQCAREGKYIHPVFPGFRLCGWHFQRLVNLVHDANMVAADSQSKKVNELLESMTKRQSDWAIKLRLKASGTPIDET